MNKVIQISSLLVLAGLGWVGCHKEPTQPAKDVQVIGRILEEGTMAQMPAAIVRLLLCTTTNGDCSVIDQNTTDNTGNYSVKIDRQKLEEYQQAADFDHFALEVYFAHDGLCGSNRWATVLTFAIDVDIINKDLIVPVLPVIEFKRSDDPGISDRVPAALDSWSIQIKLESDTCMYENQWVADHFQTPLSFRVRRDFPLRIYWQYQNYPANTPILFQDSLIVNNPSDLPESTLVELKY